MLLTDCDQREIISNRKMNSEKVKYKKNEIINTFGIFIKFHRLEFALLDSAYFLNTIYEYYL